MAQDERGGEMYRLLAELEHEIDAIKQIIEPRRSDADGLTARLHRQARKAEQDAWQRHRLLEMFTGVGL